jgi:radical SAM protein with 4Fe4S-binding SPASM domain
MSQYSRKVEQFWREHRLFSALLELTYRCNLNCTFCYNDLGLRGRAMERSDWLQLLEDLAELGCLHLALSGGEPLASPDFFAIGARARELQFVVRVKSNGHALRGALLRRLQEEVDPYVVEISLHGACAATHDRQTQVRGSFDRLMANLEEMVGSGLRVQLNSTLTLWNEQEIEGMFAIADRLGVRLQFDPEVTPRDNGDRSPLAIQATLEGLRRLYEIEARRAEARSQSTYGSGEGLGTPLPGEFREVVRQGDALPSGSTEGTYCGAGSGAIAVDPFGNVYPCVQWRRPLGNLQEKRLQEIWNSSQEAHKVRDLGRKIASRLKGEEPELMSFCPGIAEQLTGDPTQIYKAAAERRELVRALRGARAHEAVPARVRLPVLP